MNSKSNALVNGNPTFEARVFIAYQNAAAGTRAAAVAKALVKRLGAAISGQASVWRFDILEGKAAFAAASAGVEAADVIIFAADDSTALPPAADRLRGIAARRRPGNHIVIDLGGPRDKWSLSVDWDPEHSLALAG